MRALFLIFSLFLLSMLPACGQKNNTKAERAIKYASAPNNVLYCTVEFQQPLAENMAVLEKRVEMLPCRESRILWRGDSSAEIEIRGFFDNSSFRSILCETGQSGLSYVCNDASAAHIFHAIDSSLATAVLLDSSLISVTRTTEKHQTEEVDIRAAQFSAGEYRFYTSADKKTTLDYFLSRYEERVLSVLAEKYILMWGKSEDKNMIELLLVERNNALSAQLLEKAEFKKNESMYIGEIVVQCTPEGKSVMEKTTSENIGRRLALYVEQEVLFAAVIQTKISGGTFVITGGNATYQEREAQAHLLQRAIEMGSYKGKSYIISERTVSEHQDKK